MKIKLDLPDLTIEATKEPMDKHRFHMICGLVFAGISAGTTIGATLIVGAAGLLVLLPAGIIGLIAAMACDD